jgi:hypothetical protein
LFMAGMSCYDEHIRHTRGIPVRESESVNV